MQGPWCCRLSAAPKSSGTGNFERIGAPTGAGRWARSTGSADQMNGWAGGGQITGSESGPKKSSISCRRRRLGHDRRHDSTTEVLTNAERAGDFSAAGNVPVDPLTGVPFPQGRIPADRLDPLMQKYLETFLPTPNLTATHARTHEDLRSKTDSRRWPRSTNVPGRFPCTPATISIATRVHEPIKETLVTTPGTIDKRRQPPTTANFQLFIPARRILFRPDASPCSDSPSHAVRGTPNSKSRPPGSSVSSILGKTPEPYPT